MPSAVLIEAVRGLDRAERALLSLSLRRGVDDSVIAEILGTEAADVARRRADVIARIARDSGAHAEGLPAEIAQLPSEAWDEPPARQEPAEDDAAAERVAGWPIEGGAGPGDGADEDDGAPAGVADPEPAAAMAWPVDEADAAPEGARERGGVARPDDAPQRGGVARPEGAPQRGGVARPEGGAEGGAAPRGAADAPERGGVARPESVPDRGGVARPDGFEAADPALGADLERGGVALPGAEPGHGDRSAPRRGDAAESAGVAEPAGAAGQEPAGERSPLPPPPVLDVAGWTEPLARAPARGRRRRRAILWAVLAALAIAGVALVAALGGDDGERDADRAQSPAGGGSPPAEQPSGRRTLDPIGGRAGRARGTIAVEGGRITVDVTGLPRIEGGGTYQVWLYRSVSDARSLGAFANAYEIDLDADLPDDSGRYSYVDISREPADGNANHSGASVLRAPLPR